MKQRILTGVVAGLAFIGALFTMYTVVFPFIVALLSVIGVFEALKAVQLKNTPMRVLALVTAAVIPLYVGFGWRIPLLPVLTGYVILTFVLMLVEYERTKFEHAVFSLFASLVIPYAFSALLLLRDLNKTFPDVYKKADGVFFVLLGLFCAWMTDIFAFFAGSFLGKHKLAPKISPKKTVEGAIGGIIGTTLLNVALLAVFKKFFFEAADTAIASQTVHFSVSYGGIILISVVLAIVSMCGDLSASTLKRNYEIKDFGNLLPGHGGVLDRFDSYLFVMPVLYAAIVLMNQ